MPNIRKYSLIICVLFTSCFQDVEFEFSDNIASKLVIEGLLTNQDKPIKVWVSKTTSINDSADCVKIENAEVKVSDDFDNEALLLQVEPGLYQTNEIKGLVGHTYTLEVKYEGEVYTANETMFVNQNIDSLYVTSMSNNVFFEDGKYVVAQINVHDDTVKYSRIIITENDSTYTEYHDLVLFETSFLIGKSEVLIPYVYKSGDIIVLETYSLSQAVNNYYEDYYKITTGEFSASLVASSNPPSNISGGCLGYFQVSAVRRDTIVIP